MPSAVPPSFGCAALSDRRSGTLATRLALPGIAGALRRSLLGRCRPFGPEAPGSIHRRCHPGSHQPPGLCAGSASVTRPDHSPRIRDVPRSVRRNVRHVKRWLLCRGASALRHRVPGFCNLRARRSLATWIPATTCGTKLGFWVPINALAGVSDDGLRSHVANLGRERARGRENGHRQAGTDQQAVEGHLRQEAGKRL